MSPACVRTAPRAPRPRTSSVVSQSMRVACGVAIAAIIAVAGAAYSQLQAASTCRTGGAITHRWLAASTNSNTTRMSLVHCGSAPVDENQRDDSIEYLHL